MEPRQRYKLGCFEKAPRDRWDHGSWWSISSSSGRRMQRGHHSKVSSSSGSREEAVSSTVEVRMWRGDAGEMRRYDCTRTSRCMYGLRMDVRAVAYGQVAQLAHTALRAVSTVSQGKEMGVACMYGQLCTEQHTTALSPALATPAYIAARCKASKISSQSPYCLKYILLLY
jgi:hypothetical protein